MVRLLCYSLIAWMIAFESNSQDSLVRFNELKFDSEFEKSAFDKFFKENEKRAVIDLFLSVSTEGPGKKDIANARINDLVIKLQASGIDKKKPEKKVKTIYDQVHSTFLIKYELISHFNEIFSTGNYNCVTASALYAIIFDKLDIPYAIQEKPTHVFLVAYPNQYNVLVETTSPLFGYLNFDARYKEKFISNLKDSKLIGAAEASSQSTEELFNKYYFQNENIDIRKLIGIHYMNNALYKNDNGNVIEAFKQCEKAYFFYPSPRCSFLLLSFAVDILQKKIEPTGRALLIAKISRYKDQGITVDAVKGEFLRLNEDVLVKQGNRSLYNECADIIVNNGVQDVELIKEIRYIQYYEIGRANYNQGSYSLAKYFFAKALEQQPNNTELGATFFNALVLTMRQKKDEAGILDTVLFYRKRFPSLQNNQNFNSLTANAFLVASSKEMDGNNVELAEGYLKNFEDMYGQNKDLIIDSNATGNAYSKLCSYYFKKGQKEKAKTLLKQGLEIAPDNYELRVRQQMIN